jgi:Domain of unknown function (DUF4352)
MLYLRRSVPRSALVIALTAVVVTLTSCGEKAKPVPAFGMGERAGVGHLVYTAFETQWLTQLGQDTAARIPQNRFLVVRMSIGNSGGAAITVPNLTIEDDRGNSYAELTNGDQVSGWMGALRQVGPGDTLQGTVLFDVAPRHYRLRVFDENSQQSALIDMPLNFSSDSPSLPPPATKP